jgi:hypothetical protein
MSCDVCGANEATHEFDIFKESGGDGVHTCTECTGLGKRLALVVKDEFCLWCWERASGKYEWHTYARPDEPTHAICGDCREEIIFCDGYLSRGPRGELK